MIQGRVMNKRTVGSEKEELAIRYLREHGVNILCRNFRSRAGEIDIIGREDNTIVFFEVKYRKNERTGTPQEAVTFSKQKTICRVADFYRVRYRIPYDAACRFDVIAILGEQITWLRNAFDYIGSM